tara:strand:+ start:1176 stop:1622 length:447 start_codon:yes stop_codon:yes gene_type:complete
LIENPQLIGLIIGIGMLLSLMLTETLGVTAGGVIVPGYIALYLDQPYKIITTLIVALIVLFIIRFLSNFIFIYGKRRLVLSLLLGFLFGYFSKIYLGELDASIGNIIPGLLASWMDRQGVLKTISVLMIIAVATRLIFIVLMGGYFYV